MTKKTSTEQPQKQKNKTVEINAEKHRKYKLHAVKNGVPLKKMVEQAMDELINKK